MHEIDRAHAALQSIPPDLPRDEWHEIGRAAIAAGLTVDDVDTWSAPAENYKGRRDVEAAFRTIKPEGGTGAGTLFHHARQHGFGGTENARPSLPINQPTKAQHKPVKQAASADPSEIWSRCLPADAADAYINRKHGKPDGLRLYPATAAPLIIRGQNVSGYLALPCWDGDTLQTIQFIPPNGGDKLNLPGATFGNGFFTVGEITDRAYIVEGIGQAWAVNQATGAAAVVTFGAGGTSRVATALKAKHPSARLVIVPDRGKEAEAEKIAADVSGQWVEMPNDKPGNYDANDYAAEHGNEALAALLERVQVPPSSYPLSIVFADELPDTYSPPDEIVEGVLTAGAGSVLYGDSNSGKTYLVIDMACAIARGVRWMGKRTEQGLVVYLAAESPASVRSRLQAYQRHHKATVPNFVIVQSPIDLFDGDADTDKVIQLVHQIAGEKGLHVRLIVGDTLARLSAGANENAGQDMGQVIRRFDRIRTECSAHFLLIHHSGKNAAAGSRGWSGVRAAVDTELEVTDGPGGRCCEITKQRDLSTKGERIGFRLDTVTLGLTKWGLPATNCVVVPADAPAKQTGKRVSEVGGAVLEYLRTEQKGIRKRELVQHFEGQYDKSAVYRELKKLVEAGQVRELIGGFVTVAGAEGAD